MAGDIAHFITCHIFDNFHSSVPQLLLAVFADLALVIVSYYSQIADLALAISTYNVCLIASLALVSAILPIWC